MIRILFFDGGGLFDLTGGTRTVLPVRLVLLLLRKTRTRAELLGFGGGGCVKVRGFWSNPALACLKGLVAEALLRCAECSMRED